MWRLAALLPLCLLCAASGDDIREYPRIDPNNPGGERLGADDGDDGFTGYPADPGEPGDAYHDTSAEYRAYSPNYTGAYLAGGALAGFAALRGEPIDRVDRAPAYGAFLNWSSNSQIIDLQFQYLRARFDTVEGGLDTDRVRQTVGANLLFHPLFLSIIGGRTGYIVANTYFLTGVGLEINDVHRQGQQPFDYRSPGWRIGGGTGTFLDNPNDGGGFWLGIQFQRTYVQGAANDPNVGRQKLHENALFIRLSYRRNGNIFRGFSAPPARTSDSHLP